MQVEQNNLRLIACPHVLSIEKGRIDVMRPAGGTVKDLMHSIAWTSDLLNARVFIDGVYIKEAAWEYTTPQAGQAVIVRAIPMGGGGGGGKDVIMIVAMVAIMAAAIASGQLYAIPLAGATGMSIAASSAVITGAVSIAGTLAITALIPAPLPRRALPQPVREHELMEAA
jgi:hypothetical protein